MSYNFAMITSKSQLSGHKDCYMILNIDKLTCIDIIKWQEDGETKYQVNAHVNGELCMWNSDDYYGIDTLVDKLAILAGGFIG